MNCFEESRDGTISVELLGARNYSRRSHPQETDLQDQIANIQREFPALLKQDVASANADLKAKGLLPQYEIIATSDDFGVQRNAAGEPVKLTRNEINELAMTDLMAIGEKSSNYRDLFERYHSGTDLPILSKFIPEKLSLEDVENQLKRSDLPTKDRKAFNEMINDVFANISAFNTWPDRDVKRKTIEQWSHEEKQAMLRKANAFLSPDPAVFVEELQDKDGKFSRFDWENHDNCAFWYDGSYNVEP